MRRLTDVTITSADRPAPPRAKASRAAPASASVAEPRPAKTRRRRAAPQWWRRLRTALAAAFALAVLAGGPLWLARSGAFARVRAEAGARMLDLALRAGLRVERIDFDGLKRIQERDALAALAIRPGDPIFGLDLAAAQARLAALPGMKSATIERHLPGELRVIVAEREPVAVWQNAGQYTLIDRAGALAGTNIDDFPGLPLVVGPGAPEHAAALLDMLGAERDLAARVKASQWISGLRWNLVMTGAAGEVEIRLPADDPAAAWHELARLEAEQKLLERKVSAIDLRLPDRIVLRVPGGLAPETKTVPAGPARRKAPGRDA